MRTLFTILFFAAAVVAACIKKSEIGDTYVTVSYKQTQCADKWNSSGSDSLTLVNVVHYLDSSQLYVAAINITNTKDNNGQACAACNCLTGKLINVTTLNSDSLIAKYKRIGFE